MHVFKTGKDADRAGAYLEKKEGLEFMDIYNGYVIEQFDACSFKDWLRGPTRRRSWRRG